MSDSFAYLCPHKNSFAQVRKDIWKNETSCYTVPPRSPLDVGKRPLSPFPSVNFPPYPSQLTVEQFCLPLICLPNKTLQKYSNTGIFASKFILALNDRVASSFKMNILQILMLVICYNMCLVQNILQILRSYWNLFLIRRKFSKMLVQYPFLIVQYEDTSAN